MFASYFLEGLIVGSLLGLLLRPVLDYYVTWRAAKELDRDQTPDIRVESGDSAPSASRARDRRVS